MTPNAYLYFNIAIFIKCHNDVIMMSSNHVHQAIVRSKLITISFIQFNQFLNKELYTVSTKRSKGKNGK